MSSRWCIEEISCTGYCLELYGTPTCTFPAQEFWISQSAWSYINLEKISFSKQTDSVRLYMTRAAIQCSTLVVTRMCYDVGDCWWSDGDVRKFIAQINFRAKFCFLQSWPKYLQDWNILATEQFQWKEWIIRLDPKNAPLYVIINIMVVILVFFCKSNSIVQTTLTQMSDRVEEWICLDWSKKEIKQTPQI